jgi:hypothetical protein
VAKHFHTGIHCVSTWILTLELILMHVMSVGSHSAPEITWSTTVRFIQGIGRTPVMCVGRLSSRAGTSSSISAHTRVNVRTSVRCVRRHLHSAPHWPFTSVCILDRGLTSVIYVTMILYARLFLRSTRKLIRSAQKHWSNRDLHLKTFQAWNKFSFQFQSNFCIDSCFISIELQWNSLIIVVTACWWYNIISVVKRYQHILDLYSFTLAEESRWSIYVYVAIHMHMTNILTCYFLGIILMLLQYICLLLIILCCEHCCPNIINKGISKVWFLFSLNKQTLVIKSSNHIKL